MELYLLAGLGLVTTELVVLRLLVVIPKTDYYLFLFLPWKHTQRSRGTTSLQCTPTFDPSVQYCMTCKVFLAHKGLGTLFTFVWLGSLMNVLDMHDEAGATIESLATVLTCIAVLSCSNNNNGPV
jgi:hypothetical protein